VANLISVPLQSNFNFFDIDKKLGPLDLHRNTMGYLLNVQPVIPFKVSDEWNAITRTIVPIANQPQLVPGMGSHGGLGDIQFTPFLSPAKPGEAIWGVGPALVFPSATDQWLGSGKFSAGPSGVVLRIDGPCVYGALAQNVWSYAGDSDRDYVNQMLIQPFVNYDFPKGWYLTSSPIITADWHADSDQRWTVPVGGGIGRFFRIGKLPVNMQLQSFCNVVHPDFGSEWSVSQDGKWAQAGHVSGQAGKAGYVANSSGQWAAGAKAAGGGGAVKTSGGDVYAGRDGNVYKTSEGQWQKYPDEGLGNGVMKRQVALALLLLSALAAGCSQSTVDPFPCLASCPPPALRQAISPAREC
jgi:hypothetical protein